MSSPESSALATVDRLHRREPRAEDALRHRPEGRHVAGGGDPVAVAAAPPFVRRLARSQGVQQVLDGQRGGEGGVDDLDLRTDTALDQRPQQRVVGAAQQQGVDGRIGRSSSSR